MERRSVATTVAAAAPDGADTDTYCSHCYRQFVKPYITVQDTQQRVKATLVEAGTCRLLVARLIRGVRP